MVVEIDFRKFLRVAWVETLLVVPLGYDKNGQNRNGFLQVQTWKLPIQIRGNLSWFEAGFSFSQAHRSHPRWLVAPPCLVGDGRRPATARSGTSWKRTMSAPIGLGMSSWECHLVRSSSRRVGAAARRPDRWQNCELALRFGADFVRFQHRRTPFLDEDGQTRGWAMPWCFCHPMTWPEWPGPKLNGDEGFVGLSGREKREGEREKLTRLKKNKFLSL